MSIYTRYKQPIDQAAHLVVGAGVVIALGIAMPWLAAFAVMMMLALVREFVQHKGFDLGAGSALDLGFFAIGGALAALV